MPDPFSQDKKLDAIRSSAAARGGLTGVHDTTPVEPLPAPEEKPKVCPGALVMEALKVKDGPQEE